MSPKPLLPRLLALATAVGLLAASACLSEAPACSACGRQECANLTATVSWQGGAQDRTCCPRCALHLLAGRQQPASVAVRDFDTSASLLAEEALFVEGSDVHPCRGVQTSPPMDAHGCCLAPAYDRCEPSLLAFSGQAAAKRFMAEHGGSLTDWQTLAGDLHSSPDASSPSGRP